MATRVRCDILKAIALKIASDTHEAYVTPFSSRPVLHIKDIKGEKPPYALTFSDAIARYSDVLRDDDLGDAYRRAGNTFNRQMRQTFVVLKDESGTRAAALAARGRGGYTPAARGAPYRGRGSWRGRGAVDQRGKKRGNEGLGGRGGGYGFGKRGAY